MDGRAEPSRYAGGLNWTRTEIQTLTGTPSFVAGL
jgi:hypothetical protein